jgi:MFS family permease
MTAVAAAARGMWSPCGLSMLSSINPVSEQARGHRWWATALWYMAGATVGGGAFGAGCAVAAYGLSAAATGSAWLWGVVLAGAVIALLADTSWTPFTLPVHPRQVDERWLTTYRRWIYAGGYGVQIGTGFATYIMSAAVYLTALLAVMTSSAMTAFTVGLTFGVVRGLGVLVTIRARTPEQLRSLIARVDRLGEPCLQLARTVEACVGVVAAQMLAGPLGAAAALAVLGPLTLARRQRRISAATG